MKATTLLLVTTALCTSVASHAGEAKIKWGDLNDYTDARPANEVRSKFHERLIKQFDKHFNFEAQNNLPEGYVFNAEIKDLDLAGDVRYGMNEFRIIEDLYIPRIKFSYSVTDKDGKVLSEGDVNIKDMGFMDRIRTFNADKQFYYDFRLISSWFDETLYPELGIEPTKKFR
ncbi:DUF3016 domain-containing protein [Pseudoalteromonas sp. SSDWG2]|uniref:DUF3016 domain-containing protein n=1 Tax=Pseudoalteromonas sp. SSDWG2 TaxID=3139391 RepID=UPI003BA88FCD